MSWLLPSALGIGAAASIVAVALHFISRSRPLAEPLPTARFIPMHLVQARSRSISFSDLLLLLLRIGAIAAVTMAVAGPMFGSRGRIARIIIADRSRDVASVTEVRDSVRAYLRAGDELVVFDSAAAGQIATLDTIVASGARGSLSAALAAAIRTASLRADGADSLELVLVSSIGAEEIDDATLKLRAEWPGRIRIARVAAAAASADLGATLELSKGNDAVAAGLSLVSLRHANANGTTIRVLRGYPSSTDSTWARQAGHVLLVWPDAETAVTWPARRGTDVGISVSSATGTLVAPLRRPWVLTGNAVARWTDGEPAVVERSSGDGCIRDAGILLDPTSDVALRPAFRAFARALVAPCGGGRMNEAADTSITDAIANDRAPLALASAFRDASTRTSSATPWLLALAAGLLLGELALRRTNVKSVRRA